MTLVRMYPPFRLLVPTHWTGALPLQRQNVASRAKPAWWWRPRRG